MLSPFVYYSSFAHATYCCTHNISYVQSVDMIFAFDYLNDRERVTSKLSCHFRISKSLIALLFRCSINVSSRTRLRVGFGCFEGTCARHYLHPVLQDAMQCCVAHCSESVPTETTEPTLEAQSSRHVFIETLQSKDFSEILLICVNFDVTASRCIRHPEAKIYNHFSWTIPWT